jgi:RNA polymerase subunit RPABC4/transcription elongation factor Spt4
MAYRVPAEKVNDDAPVAPTAEEAFCNRCRVSVTPTEDHRCPQCLRRSTLVARGWPAAGEPTAAPAPADEIFVPPPEPAPPGSVLWPENDTCPLCGDREVDESTVFLRVSRVASGFGSAIAGIMARIHVCAPCRDQVVRLERARWGALAALFLGTPLALLAFTGGVRVLLGILGVWLAIGPLVSVARRNRALRSLLDASGVTAQVAERVPWPSGLFTHEHWVLHARLPRGREAIDLTALD